MRTRTAVAITLVALSLGLGLTACGSDDDSSSDSSGDQPTTAEATQSLCSQKDEITKDVASVRAVDPATATIGDLKGAADAIGTKVDELGSDAQAVADAQWQDVKDAYVHLDDVISDINDDTALAAAKDQVAAAQQGVVDAWTAFFTDVDCSAGS